MAKPITGTLIKRGKKWYVRFMVKGKLFTECTHTGNKKMARSIAQEKIAPYRVTTTEQKAAALRRAADHLDLDAQAIQDEAAALHEENKPRLPLADVWAKFPYTTSSPRRSRTARQLSDENIKQNRYAWQQFVDFIAEQCPQHKHIEEVTEDDALAYSRHLREERKLSEHRHNALIMIAGVMFRRAGITDPFMNVPRYAAVHQSRQHLEVEELKAICSAATGDLRLLFAVCLYTGLRMKDACLLTWEEVNLKHNRLIRRTAKTGKEVAFPIHSELRAVLEETRPDERTGYIIPGLAARYQHDRSSISRMIRLHFQEKAKLTTQTRIAGRKNAVSVKGLHSFRHAFVTFAARAGVPVGAIAAWVGHSPEVDRIYQHWGDKESQAKILEALPSLKETKPPALLPARADKNAELIRVLKGMTAETWQQARDQALSIIQETAPGATPPKQTPKAC